ncbi:MAG: DMT family transporter [Chitinophagales bacterium]
MVWIYVFLASVCETFWASSLKFLDFKKMKQSLHTKGFLSKEFGLAFLPLTTYIAFGILNMVLLTMALKLISLAVCYAVWIGFGLILQTMIDILIFKERITLKQIGFILLLLFGIIGLQMDLGK